MELTYRILWCFRPCQLCESKIDAWWGEGGACINTGNWRGAVCGSPAAEGVHRHGLRKHANRTSSTDASV